MAPRCQAALVPWCHGATVPWGHGALLPWCHGAMAPRCQTAFAPWCHGATVPECHSSMAPRRVGAMARWCLGALVQWRHVAMVLRCTDIQLDKDTTMAGHYTSVGVRHWRRLHHCTRRRIPLVHTSFELAVRRARKAPKGTVPSPSPDRHAATRSCRGSSSSSPPTADGFGTGTPVPSPQSQSFSRSYGSILPTSLAYIVPSTRGCSPWRPDAVMSTTGRGRSYDRASTAFGPPNFQGPPGAHRTPRDVRCSSSRWTLPPAEPIPGCAGC
ncbi:hypothetical protein CQW23_35078 [Capsicum baccatum]|uniref:Protein TAR1 n=1 Tax=Capsicum baccatum TaxID=33114 RepID=A0A2G2UX22_CAPBA|nr:hypothetical protein CQW23_35078 [Capsicum baccatum]